MYTNNYKELAAYEAVGDTITRLTEELALYCKKYEELDRAMEEIERKLAEMPGEDTLA